MVVWNDERQEMDRENSAGRENVRVEVFFPIRWRKPENTDDLKKSIINHRTCDRFSAPPTAFADLPADLTDLAEFQETSPHIYRMWMALERKIDHIIWLMNKNVFDDADMDDGVCLDLSVGGASVQISQELLVGEEIHLRMSLPMFPVFLVEAVGKALSSKQDVEKEGKWIANLEFTAINTSDSEDLISFIFKRQREILRDGSTDV